MGNLKNEFSWSFSSSKRAEECPREHYLAKYLAWNGWMAKEAFIKRKAYHLKKMTSLPGWKGDLLHRVIKRTLLATKRGQEVSFSEVCDNVTATATREYKESEQNTKAELPHPKKVALVEHYYDHLRNKFISERTLPRAIDDMLDWADNFYHGEVFQEIKGLDTHAWLALEDLDAIEIAGEKVWVVLDLAYRFDDEYCKIIDWKTGNRKDLDRRQLSIYAMYAKQKWKFDTDAISLSLIYLKEGKDCVATYDKVTDKELDATEKFIADDILRMKGNLEWAEGNVPKDISKYPKCSDDGSGYKCKNCCFYALCWGENAIED